jgi:hypothetical protein
LLPQGGELGIFFGHGERGSQPRYT